MSDATGAKFSCDACNRSYTWKPELAGRRVKCKCGAVMTVPAQVVKPEPSEDALYDLVDSEPAPQKLPPLRAPVGVTATAPAGGRAASGGAAAQALPRGAATLGYQRGPTEREKDRFSNKTLIDMNRDAYVPAALLIFGLAMNVGYYAIRYRMGGTGIAAVSMGLLLMTAIKAGALIGFAFTVAGPLGVSFGGIWTAVLKLAAVAASCDGLMTLVDAGMVKLAGPGGAMYGGIFDFFLAVGVYWVLLIYLFNMDPGDSYMVVVILSVFDMIVRWALVIFLLATVMSWGGVAVSVPFAGGGGGFGSGGGGGKSSIIDPEDERLEELKERKMLHEAREYIAGGRQEVFGNAVNAWYAAGCKNVWFEVDRDINGRESPDQVIVELPRDKVKDKAARLKCYQILADYYKAIGDSSGGPVVDKGENYIHVGVR